jgi:hypothetical protein
LAKTYGCGKTIVTTIPTSTLIVGARETQRQALNALIVGNTIGASDVCDIANTAFEKSDGTHPTTAGHATIANAFDATITGLGY